MLKHINKLSVLLLIISGMLLSGLTLAKADSETTENYCNLYKLNGASLTEEIFEQAGVNIDLETKNVFGGTQKKPQVKDLYLSLYKSIKESPGDEAMEQIAEANQMTQVELCSIFGGNYQLLSTIYDKTYDNQELIEEVDRLTTDYADAYEKSIRNQNALLNVYPQEIFVNGDTGDSGFDVMYDLALIEYILFGEDSAIGEGGDLDIGSWNEDDTPEDDGVESEAVESEESSSAADEGEESDTEETADTGAEETETSIPDDSEVTPAGCAADAELQAAFAAAGISPTEDETTTDTEEGRVSRDSGDDGEDDGGGEETTDGEEIKAIDVLGTLPDTSSAWETPNLCNSVFCLTIEFRNRDESRYEETSNCVKCHVDYIVETLDKTTSVSLNPGKMSGNLLEPGMCKRSMTGGKINVTFVAIPMPIPTPPPDDIVSKTNFWENFEDFVKDTWSVDEADMFVNEETYSEGGYDRDGSESTEEEEEEEHDKFFNFFDKVFKDKVKQEAGMDDIVINNAEIIDKAFESYDATMDEIDSQFEEMQTYARTSASRDFYQNLQYEMNQMVFYFTSYQTLIEATQELVSEFKNNLSKVN